jgi:hypothetical protein
MLSTQYHSALAPVYLCAILDQLVNHKYSDEKVPPTFGSVKVKTLCLVLAHSQHLTHEMAYGKAIILVLSQVVSLLVECGDITPLHKPLTPLDVAVRLSTTLLQVPASPHSVGGT